MEKDGIGTGWWVTYPVSWSQVWNVVYGYSTRVSDELVQSDGLAVIHSKDSAGDEQEETCDIFVFFVSGKVAFLNISGFERNGRAPIYRVRSYNEECYLVEERDVIYIEACHNHVIWHCSYGSILSNNSLRNLEEQVSNAFVRIQRGYLVNKFKVRHIRRCEVIMSNGDILSIPIKKYVSIREKLFLQTE